MGQPRKRSPDDMMPRSNLRGPMSVDKVLESAFRRYGIDADVKRYKFVLSWPEIIGRELAQYTKPEQIRNRALVVRVCNSTWAQELVFHKEAILRRLRPYLEAGEVVEDIQFKVA